MKRKYLTVPGQSATISVEAPTGSGKEALVSRILGVLEEDGLVFRGGPVGVSACGRVETVTVFCPTRVQVRDRYLKTLDDHQRETLRAHLDALGFEL